MFSHNATGYGFKGSARYTRYHTVYKEDLFSMMSLRNTIAHVLEHQDYLEQSNEATAQQYVVLPILRALGWNDSDLSSREVLPEHPVERYRVDYALTVGQVPSVFIECKKWNAQLTRHEEQICFYAYSAGVPIAIITNGKVWRFYLSQAQAPSLSDRIFCETDIANPESASTLEAYLSKSNVESGEAELDAEIKLEDRAVSDEPEQRHVEPDAVPAAPTNLVDSPWTVARVRDSIPQEMRNEHETRYPQERRDAFYSAAADVQNLIETKGWRLNPPEFRQTLCGFWLKDKGITRVKRVFGFTLKCPAAHSPQVFVAITEEEARRLERQHGCEYVISGDRWCYYNPPDDASELLPVFEFAYRKHSGDRG